MLAPKELPKKNNIWTRTGKCINPLNVQSEDVHILDVVHALPRMPLLSQCRSFYSKAEHSVGMFDYLKAYADEIIEKFHKQDINRKDSVYDLSYRKIRMFSLVYFAGDTYLNDISGGYRAYHYHNPRIIAAVLQSVGFDYKQYKMCAKILEYTDRMVRKDVYPKYYCSSDRYLFRQPHEALAEYTNRFNQVCDIEIKMIGYQHYLYEPVLGKHGQTLLNFNLPAITI